MKSVARFISRNLDGRSTGEDFDEIFMIGHIWGFFEANRDVRLNESGSCCLVDELVEGADDLGKGFCDLLQFHLLRQELIRFWRLFRFNSNTKHHPS